MIKLAEEKKRNQDEFLKSLDKRLAELHPKFLNAVKETYPLAVLGSLCIAISAFTQGSIPQAQLYAIGGAIFFLAAFVASFLFRILKVGILAFYAYVSAFFAVVMLFFVILEFSKTNSLIANMGNCMIQAYGGLLLTYWYYYFSSFVNKAHCNKKILGLSVLLVLIGIPVVFINWIVVAEGLLNFKLFSQSTLIDLWYVFLPFIISVLGTALMRFRVIKPNKTNPQMI